MLLNKIPLRSSKRKKNTTLTERERERERERKVKTCLKKQQALFLRLVAGPSLDWSFWSFLTFLHHGIEKVERHLL